MAPAGAACGGAGGTRWSVVTPPLPPPSTERFVVQQAQPALRAAAADPANARVLVATDGARVQRSDDGGCSWHEVWRLPSDADGPSDALSQITGVDVAHVAGKSRVLLAVRDVAPATLTRSYVVRSDDGRTGWTVAYSSPGTYDPQAGWAPMVHSAGAVAYAVVPSPAGYVTYVRSDDGGRTWADRTGADATTATTLTAFAVDPWRPDEVWEWGGGSSRGVGPAGVGPATRLRRSTDGARSWSPVDPWSMFPATNQPDWRSVDVAWPRRGGPARVLVLGGPGNAATGEPPPVAAWSGDGGATFRQVVLPWRTSILQAAVAHTPSGDAVLVTTSGVVLRAVYRARVPSAADWRTLPSTPVCVTPGDASAIGYDRAMATATSPSVVVVPTLSRIELLAVS